MVKRASGTGTRNFVPFATTLTRNMAAETGGSSVCCCGGGCCMYRQPNSLHNTRNNNKRQRETADYPKAAPPFGARAAALPGIDEGAWRGGEGGWAGGRGGTGGRELGRSAGGVRGMRAESRLRFCRIQDFQLSWLKVVVASDMRKKRSAISTACPVQNREMEVP